jgi:Flp pilus assembly protein TadG
MRSRPTGVSGGDRHGEFDSARQFRKLKLAKARPSSPAHTSGCQRREEKSRGDGRMVVSRRRGRRQRGSGLVEVALISIPFFTVVLGLMAAAYLVFLYNSTAFIAQQGARWAAVRGSTSGTPATSTAVQNYVQGEGVGLAQGAVTVTTVWSPNNNPGSTVSVTVNYAAVPLYTLAFPNTLTISATSSATITK